MLKCAFFALGEIVAADLEYGFGDCIAAHICLVRKYEHVVRVIVNLLF